MLRLVALLFSLNACAPRDLTIARWQKLELSFNGPTSEGRGEPNPFAILFDVVFIGPDNQSVRVPGFYDGDGRGGLDGRVWKARFAPDRNGLWQYRTESAHPSLNGLTGQFRVTDPPTDAAELYRKGRLEYVGERYLKFREGGYWVKFGADEPENLLGTAFGLDNWDAKRREIDYLASARINSIYVMTHNLEGDANDVWPWLGATPEEAKKNRDRFDPAKLEKWRELLEYLQSKGIVIQLVLEDDSAWKGYDHARYYREMVARFGYLPALCINFGEEHNENYSLTEALAYMKLLGEIDPYRHPRAIHNVNYPLDEYLDSPHVELTSIQTGPRRPASLNRLAADWMAAPLARGRRPLVVSFDEARPAEDRRSWWSVYLGGGMWESLARVPEGFAKVEPVWRELAASRTFLESLPFHQMHPSNHVVLRGEAFCLARPGELYALYLPQGGSVDLDLPAGKPYRVEWFDPRGEAGDPWKSGGELAGGRQSLQAPDGRDWAVRLTGGPGFAEVPPTTLPAKFFSANGKPVAIRLAAIPGSPGFDYRLTSAPKHGTLTGTGGNRIYTPRRGFTGEDSFQWQAIDGPKTSNIAAVTIVSNAAGVNTPPKAHDEAITVAAGSSRSLILRYDDPDGPGPYQVRIVVQPRHGTVEGLDNDVVYTPAPGFQGEDVLHWLVSDGKDRSNRARLKFVIR